MSTTASTIAQQVCTFLEQSQARALGDDSDLARDIDRAYPQALDICIAAHDFSYARRVVNLAEITQLPATEIADPDLPVTYALPGDYVALRHVYDDVKFRIDGTYLRSDQSGGVMIRYSRRMAETKFLPASFQTAIAAQIAVLLAPFWVTTRTKRETLKDDFQSYLHLAISADRGTASSSRLDGQPDTGDWVTEATR